MQGAAYAPLVEFSSRHLRPFAESVGQGVCKARSVLVFLARPCRWSIFAGLPSISWTMRNRLWHRHLSGGLMTSIDIQRIEQLLSHQFADHDLLKRALTHASLVDSRLESNERLEFLGDSVLGLVVCSYL